MSTEPNRLAAETSLYLRQHAHNPVDWFPWGEEAFVKARAENKPIFLSIGYSACHWCHVMERESFEDAATAEVLNAHFVAIKVDREERPDVDQIYMNVVQLLTGHGGWPLSVFLDPQARPITGGTYFPPERRYGMPSFRDVLETVAVAWREKAETLGRDAERLLAGVQRMESLGLAIQAPEAALLERLEDSLAERFDEDHGGFSTRPKFPNPTFLAGLLVRHQHGGSERALAMVRRTLEAMADGGIYDHLGGGFHRYSTDERWLVPHFEKMLYDNALLAPLYLELFQLTGERRFAGVAREIFAWLEREMRAPDGGYCATQDADSEGVEGRFFVWTPAQIADVLGAEAGARFCAAWGVSDEGNFEHGASVLHRAASLGQLARRFELDELALAAELEQSRAALFAARASRVAPATDTKRIAAWNGLVLRALARGAMVLDDEPLRQATRELAAFLADVLYHAPSGRLRRIHADGTTKIDGFLEDYAYVAQGMLEAFRATGEDRWLSLGRALCIRLLADFYAPETRAFHVTAAATAASSNDRNAGADASGSAAGGPGGGGDGAGRRDGASATDDGDRAASAASAGRAGDGGDGGAASDSASAERDGASASAERDSDRDHADGADGALVVRPVALYDGATPSAACVAIATLLQVAHLCGDTALRDGAEAAAERYLSIFAREPRACTSLAEALGLLLEPPTTVVIAGPLADAQALARAIQQEAAPLTDVICLASLSEPNPIADTHLAGRTAPGDEVLAWVCRGTHCHPPTGELERVIDHLFEA